MSLSLDVEDIRALLPHRFPMLLVDRIVEMVPGKRATGLKNVTINEPFFTGHFPQQAVMPGVLLLEAMAQVAGLMMLSVPEYKGKMPFIAEIAKARFRKPVVPGDALVMEATSVWVRGLIGKVQMIARVEGTVVASCEMTFALKEPQQVEGVDAKLEKDRHARNGEGDRD